MITKLYSYVGGEWDSKLDKLLDSDNTLVVVFGSSNIEPVKDGFDELVSLFPNSLIIGCSTSGEIYKNELHEKSLSVAVTKFEESKIRLNVIKINGIDSIDVGKKIAKNLNAKNLKSIFILSDGLNVNGSRLTKGVNEVIDSKVIVTGGLAGDDARFEKTWVVVNREIVSDYVTAVGFYRDSINIGYGSKGGWDRFGIDRKVTKSTDNILFELDGKPALEIYKTYLGEQSKNLPSSALLFPLIIKEEGIKESKVRTVLAVDEKNQSITFAGDIPEGGKVAFMKANFNNLIDGASIAAKKTNYNSSEPALNIAISCVGRKLVLGQRTEDEIEAVIEELGENVSQIGYYSYGEISPLSNGKCDLHNQTMTLTLIWES